MTEYEEEYRQYLKDVAEDENFDITTVEDYQTWVEEEKDCESIRCKKHSVLNCDKCKKILLKIDKNDFLSWYFDKDLLRSIGETIWENLLSGSKYGITMTEIWDGLGYLPLRLVNNPEVVRKEDMGDEDGEEIEILSAYEPEFVMVKK